MSGERILYFNFEDERLHLSSKELDLIFTVISGVVSRPKLSDCYFFFDEVQEVEGWEKFINRIYASISRHLFITGSNAKLLSKEIATALRGRTITFEIYPLSFAEYVGVLAPKMKSHSSLADKAKLISIFLTVSCIKVVFRSWLNKEDKLKDKILQEYFNVMVLRDLIERYQISNSSTLKYFCKRVVGASGR